MNECTQNRRGKCMWRGKTRSFAQDENASRTRKTSINSWINSRLQCARCMFNNKSRERIMSKFHAIKLFLWPGNVSTSSNQKAAALRRAALNFETDRIRWLEQ